MKLFSLLTALGVVVCLAGCENHVASNDEARQLSDTMSSSGLKGEAVKLVKTAGLNFKVRNVEQTAREVSSLAQSLGGMVFDQSIEAASEDKKELKVSTDSLLVISTNNPQATIEVKVPSQNLEKFMYSVADLGYYTGSSRLHIDDKSLTYLENALKEKARKEVLATAPAPVKKAGSPYVALQIRDEAIKQEIDNRAIDADVNYSTVSLGFFQNPVVQKETIANYHIESYELPFSKRLGNSIRLGWGYFADFVLFLVNLWMFILAGVVILVFLRTPMAPWFGKFRKPLRG